MKNKNKDIQKEEVQLKESEKDKKKPKKEPKRIPKYKTLSCFRWMIIKIWEWDRTMAFSAVAVIPLAITLYSLNLYIPSLVLEKLANSATFAPVVITITALLVAQLIFRLIKNFVDTQRETSRNI
ncbi:MAG: hypothetical protein PHW77_09655, partial [Eubacteriales bacterium]|nr:hypothetical protein [Eubacteriales bacterium]